jgi:hypothetical protein
MNTHMSLPLDDEGFLRRACPTCDREFKCLVAQEATDATPAVAGGYFCPYCAVQAPTDAWWTRAQLELAQATIQRDVIAPELRKLKRDVERANPRSGFIQVSVDISDEPDQPALGESNDMRRVDFTCHPDDPVKVLENWEHPISCTICAKAGVG